MKQMHDLSDTGKFYVPVATGPGTTKRSFLSFMGYVSGNDEDYDKYAKPSEGHYVGVVDGNRSVDVVGTRQTGGMWLKRSAIGGAAKKHGWKAMNITNYHEVNKEKSGRSCVMKLFDKYQQPTEVEVLQELHRRRW